MVAGAGALLFTALRIPAGAIIGSMIFTALACLAGRKLGLPPALRAAQLFIIGLGVGAAVNPTALSAAAAWPLSIIAVTCSTLATWYLSARVFQRLCRTDARTAAYATAPGAMSVVVLLAEADGADTPKVTIAQTLRISILVFLAPLAFGMGHTPPVPDAHAAPMLEGAVAWAVLLGTTLGAWALAKRLSWPLPVFIGALIGSTLVHGAGVVDVALPRELLLTATAGVGAVIGSRFIGLRLESLWGLLPASLAVMAVMAATSVPIGLAAAMLMGVGPMAGLLAFAPGSTEVMIAASLALNAHPSYVAAHHLARMILLMCGLPFLSARWRRAALSTPPA